jgi:hypothetical protein
MVRRWIRPVGDPERGLYVKRHESFEYPYGKARKQLAIGREGGSLVVLDLDEARALIKVLTGAIADLEAVQEEDE